MRSASVAQASPDPRAWLQLYAVSHDVTPETIAREHTHHSTQQAGLQRHLVVRTQPSSPQSPEIDSLIKVRTLIADI